MTVRKSNCLLFLFLLSLLAKGNEYHNPEIGLNGVYNVPVVGFKTLEEAKTYVTEKGNGKLEDKRTY